MPGAPTGLVGGGGVGGGAGGGGLGGRLSGERGGDDLEQRVNAELRSSYLQLQAQLQAQLRAGALVDADGFGGRGAHALANHPAAEVMRASSDLLASSRATADLASAEIGARKHPA